MPGPFPTPLHVAEVLRDRCDGMTDTTGGICARIAREPAPHDIRRFDLSLPDGRVYRVRVSDITPEKVES